MVQISCGLFGVFLVEISAHILSLYVPSLSCIRSPWNFPWFELEKWTDVILFVLFVLFYENCIEYGKHCNSCNFNSKRFNNMICYVGRFENTFHLLFFCKKVLEPNKPTYAHTYVLISNFKRPDLRSHFLKELDFNNPI